MTWKVILGIGLLIVPQLGAAQSAPETPAQVAPNGSRATSQGAAAPEQSGQTGASENSQVAPSKRPATAKSKQGMTASSPAKSKRRKPSQKHHPVAVNPGEPPKKVVVQHGSAPDPVVKISPPLSHQQAARQRQATNDLLAASSANLKELAGRQLNSNQQDTVSQIRNYMELAKAANNSGDMQRAQNLASKAKQLSDDLVKH
jgi:hypothetical protein